MSETPPIPTTLAAYLDTYDGVWKRLEALLATLDNEQMVVPVDEGGWNVRDHVAHICAWESTRVALLERNQQWDAFGISRDDYEQLSLDALNEMLRQVTINVSPDDAKEMLTETNQELLSLVASIPDEVLTGPWDGYHPDWVMKSAFEGTLLHLVWAGSTRHIDQHRGYIERLLGR